MKLKNDVLRAFIFAWIISLVFAILTFSLPYEKAITGCIIGYSISSLVLLLLLVFGLNDE
jgi:hypothetical protein